MNLMGEKSFDAFKLCWDVILQESAKYENKLFNTDYCKIIDSRDVNFEIVQNRLGYIYKFGYFNIAFFEKCFSLFSNQCSDILSSFENLKICSLSNGPGFDIIGLLKTLCSSNKPLKYLPVFNALNVHESWSELYKILVCTVYEKCIAKSTELILKSQTNINFMQGDIYSKLSPEANTFISDSNVLLMVNSFVSSKASPTAVKSSLKEIFTLLQPGSLIFFIGSKNNMKLVSKLTDVKKYMKCICGPQKVSLDNLPVDEQVYKITGVKPCTFGHAQFVVWQKRNEILENIDDVQYDSDATSDLCPLSESSFASSIEDHHKSKCNLEINVNADERFPSLEDWIKSRHSDQKSDSLPLEINSVENITSTLSNIKINYVNHEQKLEGLQPDNYQSNSNSTFTSTIETNNSMLNRILEISSSDSILEEIEVSSQKNVGAVSVCKEDFPANLNMNGEAVIDQSTPKKRSRKKKAQSVNKTEDQSLNGNAEKENSEHPKLPQKQSSVKDSTSQAANIQTSNYADNSLQPLIIKCNSLISKLEELTDDIKNELNSSRRCQSGNKIHFCNQRTENCKTFHHGCCIKIVHSCCCRNFCKH